MGHHKSIMMGREAEYLLRMHDPLADKHTTNPHRQIVASHIITVQR
jgi:hypothetical protein